MKITVKLIAQILQAEVIGDESIEINGPGRIENAQKGELTFLSNLKYEKYIYDTGASAVLVSREFEPKEPLNTTLIKVDSVDASLLVLMKNFANKGDKSPSVIHHTAVIHDTVEIGEGVSIGAYTVIGKNVIIDRDAFIGNQVTIHDNTHIGQESRVDDGVKIYRSCQIGSHCVIKANAVIGGEGFGYTKTDKGAYEKTPHLGRVILHDYVEIGSCVTIDRGSIGDTILHKGVKIDNLIQIAHNVEIGENTAVAAQAGFAGSAKVGANCMIGGQAAIVGHISIADGVMIQGQSGVNKTIKEANSKWYGTPVLSYTQYLKAYSIFKNLPELVKEIKQSKN